MTTASIFRGGLGSIEFWSFLILSNIWLAAFVQKGEL